MSRAEARALTLEQWRAACVVRPCPWSGTDLYGRTIKGTHRLTTPVGTDVPITSADAIHEADDYYAALQS